MSEVRIGVVDSGAPLERVAESRRFQLAAVGVSEQPAREDALGHGSAVVELIAAGRVICRSMSPRSLTSVA